jgi:Protein of unknown function (DUF4236)
LNLSKSGIGYSIGVRGFHVGKDAKGRSYTSASIPGTGLYSRNYSGSAPRPDTPGAIVQAPAGTEQRSGGNGRAVVLAFLAGGVLTLILVGRFSSRPRSPARTRTSGCKRPCSSAAAYSSKEAPRASRKAPCVPPSKESSQFSTNIDSQSTP